MRERICIDDNWLFHLGDIKTGTPKLKGPIYISSKSETEKWGPAARFYDDKSDSYDDERSLTCEYWQNVDLPHDYMMTKVPDKSFNNARGYVDYENGWYRKYIKITEADAGKRITLYFEGIATNSVIYVNGHVMKRIYCGYVPFEIDITDVLEYKSDVVNVVAVYTDAKKHSGWWYEGGGICRHVWLQKTDPICVETYGIYVVAKKCEEEKWNVLIETSVLNEKDTVNNVQLNIRILDGKKSIGEVSDTIIVEGYGKSESKTQGFGMLKTHTYIVQR